jgi:hypothetical protein
LGRSGVRAVSTADLEGGTAWGLATPLLGSLAYRRALN